jgi:hypothetical protein
VCGRRIRRAKRRKTLWQVGLFREEHFSDRGLFGGSRFFRSGLFFREVHDRILALIFTSLLYNKRRQDMPVVSSVSLRSVLPCTGLRKVWQSNLLMIRDLTSPVLQD